MPLNPGVIHMNPHQEQTYYHQLGNNIMQARKAAGLSQEILADQLSLSRASVVNIEKGRHRLMVHSLVEIADILKVKLTDLLPSSMVVEQRSKIVAASNPVIYTDQDQVDKQTKEAVDIFVSFLNNKQ